MNRRGVIHKVKIGQLPPIYLIVQKSETGKPIHVSCKGFKIGSTLFGLTDAFCGAISMALSKGENVSDIYHRFCGVSFDPKGPTSNPQIPECDSVPDYIVRFLMGLQ